MELNINMSSEDPQEVKTEKDIFTPANNCGAADIA